MKEQEESSESFRFRYQPNIEQSPSQNHFILIYFDTSPDLYPAHSGFENLTILRRLTTLLTSTSVTTYIYDLHHYTI